MSFFKHLIISISNSNSIAAHGRSEFYAILPPRVYIFFTSNKQAGYYMYRAYSMLFQLYFEFQLVAKLPRKDFLPWQTKHAPQKYARNKFLEAVDDDLLYLVKVTPRRNLFDFVPPDQLQQLIFFIKQNCISRKSRVIPTLE